MTSKRDLRAFTSLSTRRAWGPAALGLVAAISAAAPTSATAEDLLRFEMVPTSDECLPGASADVRIRALGPAEKMIVWVDGLPPETEFDLFVIQVPNPPFGLSWYQGDIETDEYGKGRGVFVGRFNVETFIVAPGEAPAPVVHDDPIPDLDTNPATGPVHTFHLGLWFNSPEDAAAAGCLDIVTPFNGDHTAGIQVLNTSNFDDLEGPLRQIDDLEG